MAWRVVGSSRDDPEDGRVAASFRGELAVGGREVSQTPREYPGDILDVNLGRPPTAKGRVHQSQESGHPATGSPSQSREAATGSGEGAVVLAGN